VVAVKVIRLEFGEEEQQQLETLAKEIRFLKECDFPNIVRIFGSYRDEENLYIVMEYCDGGGFDEIYQGNRITRNQLDSYFMFNRITNGLV
jgi:serine/threonine protein kinase